MSDQPKDVGPAADSSSPQSEPEKLKNISAIQGFDDQHPTANLTLLTDEQHRALQDIQNKRVAERRAAVDEFMKHFPDAAAKAGSSEGNRVVIGGHVISYGDD